jgi:hypothetical protein
MKRLVLGAPAAGGHDFELDAARVSMELLISEPSLTIDVGR